MYIFNVKIFGESVTTLREKTGMPDLSVEDIKIEFVQYFKSRLNPVDMRLGSVEVIDFPMRSDWSHMTVEDDGYLQFSTHSGQEALRRFDDLFRYTLEYLQDGKYMAACIADRTEQ